jgi:hypothetical protein
MTVKRALLPAGVLALSAFSIPARADVPPPGLQGCLNKAAGDACDMDALGQPTGQTGVCAMTLGCGSWVACGPDASIPVCPDAGVRPGYVYQQSPCLLCQLRDAASADAASETDGAAGATSATPPRAASDDGGCSVGAPNTRRTLGPWLLSGGVAALLLLTRRRRG